MREKKVFAHGVVTTNIANQVDNNVGYDNIANRTRRPVQPLYTMPSGPKLDPSTNST